MGHPEYVRISYMVQGSNKNSTFRCSWEGPTWGLNNVQKGIPKSVQGMAYIRLEYFDGKFCSFPFVIDEWGMTVKNLKLCWKTGGQIFANFIAVDFLKSLQ